MTTLSPAYGYLRLSFDPTSGQALSTSAQRSSILKWADLNHVEIVEWFEDDVSAFRDGVRREDWERMMSVLEASPARDRPMVIGWQFSRLARRPKDSSRLRLLAEEGLRVVTVGDGTDSSTDAGIIHQSILADFSNMESKMTSARVRNHVRELRRRGLTTANTERPFGYTKIVEGIPKVRRARYVVREDEAAYIRAVVDRYIAGDSLAGLARWLESEGVLSPRGARISAQVLGRLIEHPRNAGFIYDDDGVPAVPVEPEDLPYTIPAIITRAQHELVMERMHAQQRRGGTLMRSVRKHLLTNFLICGRCGLGLQSAVDSKNGSARYVCPSRAGGCSLSISMRTTEAHIVARVIASIESGLMTSEEDQAPEIEKLLTDIADDRDYLETLAAEGAIEGMSPREIAAAGRARREQLQTRERQLVGVRQRSGSERSILDHPHEAKDRWEAASVPVRRALLDVLMYPVTVKHVGVGQRVPVGDRLSEIQWKV